MAKKQSILPITGLDTGTPAEFIHETSSADCVNMEVVDNLLKKRTGTTLLGGANSEEIMGGMEIIRKGNKYVLRVGGTSLQYLTGPDWSDVTMSGATLTADTSYPVRMASPMLSGARIATISNYKDVILKCSCEDMTAAILAGSPPKAKFMIDFGAYLVLANTINESVPYGQRVVWCDTGNPQDWTTGSSGSKDLIEGGDITGLSLFGNYLAVHKEDAIYLGYLVTTSAVFKFDRKATGAGTIIDKSIQELPGGLQIFLAKDGVRIFNGSSTTLAEGTLNGEIKKNLNASYLHTVWSVVNEERSEYWLAIPYGSQTTPDTIYKYNYTNGTWHKDSRSGIHCAFKKTTSGQTFQNILLGDSSGHTQIVDNSLDDKDTAINSYWDSKDYMADEQEQLCRWERLDLKAKGDNVTVSYSIDSGVTWTEIETVSLNSTFPLDKSPIRLYFDVVSSKIRFRFANSTASESFTIKQFIMWYVNREMR